MGKYIGCGVAVFWWKCFYFGISFPPRDWKLGASLSREGVEVNVLPFSFGIGKGRNYDSN